MSKFRLNHDVGREIHKASADLIYLMLGQENTLIDEEVAWVNKHLDEMRDSAKIVNYFVEKAKERYLQIDGCCQCGRRSP